MLIKALKLVTSITTFPEGFGGLTPGEKETVELAHKQVIACCIKHSRGNQFARKLLEICPEQWPLILEKEIEYLCKSFEVNTVYNAEIAALTAFGNRTVPTWKPKRGQRSGGNSLYMLTERRRM